MRLDLKTVAIVGVVGLALLACDKRLDVFFDSGATHDLGVIDLGEIDGPGADVAQPDQRVKPTAQWLVALGDPTTNTFMPDGIEVDGEGNVYVEGWLSGRLEVGAELLGADGQDSHALIKLDPTGKPLWGRHVGPVDMQGPGTATWPPHNLAFAFEPASGASYLVGTFSGTAGAGSTTLTSAGKKDIYVAKLGRDGEWLWAKSAGGPEDEYAHDATNGVIGPVVVGDFVGTASFGDVQLEASGGTEIFVAHLDKSGSWAKALRAGSARANPAGGMLSAETASAVTARDGGRVLVAGRQLADASFGARTLFSGFFLAQATMQASPLAPAWDWAVRTDGVWYDLAADAASATVYGAGSIFGANRRPAVAAFEADSGKVLWGFNAHESSHDSEAVGLAVGPGGDVYVGGYFRGTLELTADGKSLTTATDANNGFLLKLDSRGQLVWVKAITSTTGTYPQALRTGPDGALYAAGMFFGGQATFDGQVLTGRAANQNAFVWKLAPQ